jgi:hypothetical protein
MPLYNPDEHPRALFIAGPYRNPTYPDGPPIYEVAWVIKGKYQATVAQCRTRNSAIARAKRERTLKKDGGKASIFTRLPSEDPILLEE